SRIESLVTAKGEQFATIEDSMCQIVATKGTIKPISDTLKSEAQIVADIATHVLGSTTNIDWQAMSEDYDVVRDYVSQAIDGFENFNQRIRDSERGFHLYHPARHRVWNTDSGKAQIEVPQYPITYVAEQMAQKTASTEQKVNPSQNEQQKVWQFTSVRSHDQFNTMIFGYNDRYRQTNRRDVLFMHPDEISRLGWQKGDSVIVTRQDSSNQARTLGPLVLTEMDIASNAVAAYYPECNDLFDLDTHAPESHIPAYKSSTVTLERVAADSREPSKVDKQAQVSSADGLVASA
ncbi:molybdopterin dinucleotide binding domain-containing protein, partial [Psychrobacter sp. 1U2]